MSAEKKEIQPEEFQLRLNNRGLVGKKKIRIPADEKPWLSGFIISFPILTSLKRGEDGEVIATIHSLDQRDSEHYALLALQRVLPFDLLKHYAGKLGLTPSRENPIISTYFALLDQHPKKFPQTAFGEIQLGHISGDFQLFYPLKTSPEPFPNLADLATRHKPLHLVSPGKNG